MDKAIGILIALVLLCGCSKKKEGINHEQYIKDAQQQIDSIYIVKDSLIQKLDTIYKQKVIIQTKYEKDTIAIRRNTPSEDLEFFTEYIERYDSIHNSQSAQAD